MRKKKKPQPAAARVPFNLLAMGSILFLAVLSLYHPAWEFGFVNWDDVDYTIDNPPVAYGLSWEGVRWAFGSFHAANWHPVTWLSHMTDCTLFGLDPGPMHAVNTLLHGFNTVLVFVTLRALTGTFWRSAVVAAIFALHPAHVESVAWIAERKDLLCAFWGLLSLFFYAKYADKPEGAIHRNRFYLISLGCFGLGLMSKPMLVTWPFLLLVLDVWPLRRGSGWLDPSMKALVREKIPYLLLTLASCAVTWAAQSQGGAIAPITQLGLWDRLSNASISYFRYVQKYIWPDPLFAPYPPVEWPPLLGAAAVLAISAGTFWAVLRFQRSPEAAAGWLWFVGLLVPVIGLVQVGNQSMADRYTYLPFLGLSTLVVWSAAKLATSRPRRNALCLFFACLLVALTWQTQRQLPHWRNGQTLFLHSLSCDPGNLDAASNLAWAYATDPDPALRNAASALALTESLTDMTQRQDPALMIVLAAAQAESGQTHLATQTIEEVLALPVTTRMGFLQDRARKHLEHYRAGKPLRPEAPYSEGSSLR
jgi:protein O-mannosyl-transferase